MKKAPITTHVLNLETGKPAAGIVVTMFESDTAEPLASAVTDSDGRITTWNTDFNITPGIYALHFAVGEWFAGQDKVSFYPEIQLIFNIKTTDEHYHVPLLLNAHGYSTYRGS